MKKKFKISKKEKNLLLVGIISGLAGGLVSNLAVTSYFSLFEPYLNWFYKLIILTISLSAFIWFIKYLGNKIEPL